MTTLLWLRNDLRLHDHPALTQAATSGAPLMIVYLLEEHPDIRPLGGAARWWLHHSLARLGAAIAAKGNQLIIRQGNPETVIPKMVHDYDIKQVLWSRRYDAVAIDKAIKTNLKSKNITVQTFNSHLILEPWQVLKDDGTPYTVYTPFWKKLFSLREMISRPLPAPCSLPPSVDGCVSDDLAALNLLPTKPDWSMGLKETWAVGEEAAGNRWQQFADESLATYADTRNRPDVAGTSRLSPYLRFGEISIRYLWDQGLQAWELGANQAEIFLKELVWREFSYNLLYHNPRLAMDPFRPAFAAFSWQENPSDLRAWQAGRTGYPIVDAGMRELWQTGWMHNRVRMIVASFLSKHLLIPWQSGEAWFWDTLVDADPASNAASWQWVAGCGADAAPYFRIFNPILQGQRFDPEGIYVKRYVPELKSLSASVVHQPWQQRVSCPDYPAPIIEHEKGRARAMAAYQALQSHNL